MTGIFLLCAGLALAAGESRLFPETLTCQTSGQIRFIDGGKTGSEASAYCFSEDHSYFLSESCKKKEKCLALSTDLSGIKKEGLAGSVGSPGFKLCRKAGGRPELLEYFDGKAWKSMDRCLFSGDASFVDTGILLRRWGRAAQSQKSP